MNKKTVRDIEVKGKKVLVRCDFNVPQLEDGTITDNRRIVAALETINYLLDNNAKVILCSHLGRPKGEFKKEFSLKPIADELSKLLGKEVKLAKDVIGESAKELTSNMKDGEVVLLENVRFHREETDNDPEFAKKLASFAEVSTCFNSRCCKLPTSCIWFLNRKRNKLYGKCIGKSRKTIYGNFRWKKSF